MVLDLTQPVTVEDWVFLEIAHAALAGDLGVMDCVVVKVGAEIESRTLRNLDARGGAKTGASTTAPLDSMRKAGCGQFRKSAPGAQFSGKPTFTYQHGLWMAAYRGRK
jgi:hypothetical protein